MTTVSLAVADTGVVEKPSGLIGVRVAQSFRASSVAAGRWHTCVVTETSGAKCWGNNQHAQLGDGTTTSRTMPVDVSGLSSGVVAVAAGWYHTCALTQTGRVKCWGRVWGNQPVDVPGLSDGVVAIAAGSDHTCALTVSGGVKCWGSNYYGQLGDGTTVDRTTPVEVSGMSSGVAAIAAGSAHTCGLMEGGGVKCWGDNYYGQLGDGTSIMRTTPVDVNGLSSGVVAIAAGGHRDGHTCAVMDAGRGGGVKCWGRNMYGQLGDGSKIDRWTPVDVVGLRGDGIVVATGGWHTCALLDTIQGRGVQCWGANWYGQLGDGTRIDRWMPVDVNGLSRGVVAIALGGGDYASGHTCAVVEDGQVQCWGANWYGQLGDGATTIRSVPVEVAGMSTGVGAVATGGFQSAGHTCAIAEGGGVRCWGDNQFGQLGDDTTLDRWKAVDVTGLSSGVTAVAAGDSFSCALTEGGGVKCWGHNMYGQLGDGTTIDRTAPVDVIGLSSGVVAIAAGGAHTCAVTEDRALKCWGRNYHGQLGDGTTEDRWTPVDVIGLSSDISGIALGNQHSCAVIVGGGAKCWGSNVYGQLGDGTRIDRTTPVDVLGLSSGVASIAAGGDNAYSYGHSCAVTEVGGVKCWGSNEYGQLGDGTTLDQLTPVEVNGLTSGVAQVSAGWHHSCALTQSGGVKCWGDNELSQLGDGTNIERWTPVDVAGLTNGVAEVAAGSSHTCALMDQSQGAGVKCWGHNHYGQLGVNPGWIPVDVVGFGGGFLRYLPIIVR
jgi:alpha-tubulin suppressor-like RCC1 family protein